VRPKEVIGYLDLIFLTALTNVRDLKISISLSLLFIPPHSQISVNNSDSIPPFCSSLPTRWLCVLLGLCILSTNIQQTSSNREGKPYIARYVANKTFRSNVLQIFVKLLFSKNYFVVGIIRVIKVMSGRYRNITPYLSQLQPHLP
jgi:hypothetical protein